jgi:pyruvate dehydrogenase E1 component beta subunit
MMPDSNEPFGERPSPSQFGQPIAAMGQTMRTLLRQFLAILGLVLIVLGVPLAFLTPIPGVPIGQARVARPGSDATVVTYGACVATALETADRLAQEGLQIEVLDLLSLQPWDEAAVLASLAKTHRLVVFHEAVTAFGVGAEIVARMADIGFDELDAPLKRVGAPFMPAPFSRELEAAFQPNGAALEAALREVLA